MAEDKNGFLLYKDLIHTVKKLPKDKAGELFMHILQYVNDENPETDDLLIELAFEPVKQKLKRDLKKYEQTKEKNRENANKRWQKEKPSESNGIAKNATACDRIPTDAKHADSDTDTDTGSDTGNDTDSDTDFLLEKETKSDLQSEENPRELFQDDKPPDPEERKKVAQKKESDDVELKFPFSSKNFLAQWDLFKIFRKKKHKFTFLNNDSENRKLTELFNLSNGDEKFAIKIIQNSIDNGYKGFFLPKNNQHGQSNNSNNGFYNSGSAASGGAASSGKTSGTTAVARYLTELTSGNRESGDFTTDAEVL